jgi:hypothetical protein
VQRLMRSSESALASHDIGPHVIKFEWSHRRGLVQQISP